MAASLVTLMAAVLGTLRAAILRGDALSVDDTAVILPDGTRLGRKDPTNFHSMRGRGDPYLLETVYFQFKHHTLPYNNYVQECAKENVAHVTVVDKRDLVAYLKGEISECTGLVTTAADSAKPPAEAAGGDPAVAPAAPSALVADDGEAATPAEAAQSPSRKRRRLGRDGASDTHKLAMAARDQRGLDAVLCAEGWDFSGLEQKVAKQVERMRANGAKMARAANGARAPDGKDPKAYDPRGDRYTAPDDRFWRENMGSDFFKMGIDPTKSFKSAGGKQGASSRGASPAPSTGSGRSSAATLPTVSTPSAGSGEQRPAAKRDGPSGGAGAAGEDRHSSRRSSGRPVERSHGRTKDQVPIIIVPASSASCIMNMVNIPLFLQEGVFETKKDLLEQERKARQEGTGNRMQDTRVLSRVNIKRKPGGSAPEAVYEVVGNPAKLTDSDWERVVACVCTGQVWQFKGWRDWSSSAADNGLSTIFRNTCGFIFHYDDETPPRATKDWAITFVSLPRHSRRNDIKAQSRFWALVDAHCRLRNGRGKRRLWY